MQEWVVTQHWLLAFTENYIIYNITAGEKKPREAEAGRPMRRWHLTAHKNELFSNIYHCTGFYWELYTVIYNITVGGKTQWEAGTWHNKTKLFQFTAGFYWELYNLHHHSKRRKKTIRLSQDQFYRKIKALRHKTVKSVALSPTGVINKFPCIDHHF